MKFELKTKTTRKNAKQYYFVDGVEVPRVTEVIGQIVPPGLLNWYASKTPDEIKETRRTSLSTGSNLHELMEAVLLHGFNEKMRQTPFGDVLEAYSKWIATNKVKPVKTEEYVYDIVGGKYGYAGRTDAIVEIDGELALIDYKTSTGSEAYESHWQQLAAYAGAYPDDIKRVIVLVIEKCKDGTFALHPHELVGDQRKPYYEMFIHLLKYYLLVKEANKKVSK